MSLAIIILTKNEEIHLSRCLDSIKKLDCDVFICDSFSDDKTLDVARKYGCNIIQNKWVNYSNQFNWALDQLPNHFEWVFRLDADEVLSDKLVSSVNFVVNSSNISVNGYTVPRYMSYMGDQIRFGGLFPVHVVRLFRKGKGVCENRWMDEHIKVDGDLASLSGELVDDSLKNNTFWVEKHNLYANREALDYFLSSRSLVDNVGNIHIGTQAKFKRFLKDKVYSKVPLSFRVWAYFFVRYFLFFGVLDRKGAAKFHFMQGLWYRYLVDLRINEVQLYVAKNSTSYKEAFSKVLQIDVDCDF